MRNSNIVFDIKQYGANSIRGYISSFFDNEIPKCVFGSENKGKYIIQYTFYIIVPENSIEEARAECAKMKLNYFVILSNKGMIIGG